jgi:hypothetical protein
MYLKCVIGVIPGVTCFFAWILTMMGTAPDYKQDNNDAKYNDFVGTKKTG